MKNVQDRVSRPLGGREIQKTKVETVLLDTLYVSEYFPTSPDYITAHAEVLGGRVLCPALLRLTMSHPGGMYSSTRVWV